jgi:(2Fe-2S) ferredoxin
LLVLPDGLLYGRVDTRSAQAIAREALDGRVVPSMLRGRCSLPPAAQAAEWFVRHRLSLAGGPSR